MNHHSCQLSLPENRFFSGILVGDFNHLEKYESQLGRIIPIILWKNNSHVPNHQPLFLCQVTGPQHVDQGILRDAAEAGHRQPRFHR